MTKIEKKGRTEGDLQKVIRWLISIIKAKLNPNPLLIKGAICGYSVEEIENSRTQKVWYLDKLVDELARGKKMESILRRKANSVPARVQFEAKHGAARRLDCGMEQRASWTLPWRIPCASEALYRYNPTHTRP